uniref:Uncharacterized protein n=1 Tax=Rhizophora mucronata TaxID=61149 RepID=A0A2P2PPN5_RHIMU
MTVERKGPKPNCKGPENTPQMKCLAPQIIQCQTQTILRPLLDVISFNSGSRIVFRS